jgi:hypothetical protein
MVAMLASTCRTRSRPGGTVQRVETDAEDDTYEPHMTVASGPWSIAQEGRHAEK